VPDNDRAAAELWLRANGAPWLVTRNGAWRQLASDLSGLLAIFGFALRWFATSLVRSRSALVNVLPLLLVAVVLAFFSTETWQTIGSLHGLPIVLVLALFIGLASAFVASQAKPDLGTLAEFTDAGAVGIALPDHVRVSATLVDGYWRAPPLRRAERVNLLLVSVLAQVLAAAVIGLAVAAFFVLLGLFSVDVAVTESWIGHSPRVLMEFTLAGHEYALSSQLLRVSAFLGTFAGFYFIVSSTTDQRMRQSAVAHHQDHLRTVLAVRSVYRGLLPNPPPDVDPNRGDGAAT
jgi:hypothetical protein